MQYENNWKQWTVLAFLHPLFCSKHRWLWRKWQVYKNSCFCEWFFFIHATKIFFEKSNSYLEIMIFTYTRKKLVTFLFSIFKYAFTLVFLSVLTGKFLIHFSNCFTAAEDNFVSTAVTRKVHTPSREERRFLYFNHLSQEFLEQMIPHLKDLI